MFVDLNRGPDHPHVCPAVCYGAIVPGNAHLSPGDRAARVAAFHAPYWVAVRRECKARLQTCGEVLHFSSHTFDPALDPATRTFDVGVLYDPAHAFEAALAERLLFQLRAAGLDVRANQPYSGVGAAICTSLRIEFAGQRYAGIQLETSHRVTHTQGGCARVAAAVIPFLDDLPAVIRGSANSL
jgi:predicted N-formylglutamate amidohydrolase